MKTVIFGSEYGLVQVNNRCLWGYRKKSPMNMKMWKHSPDTLQPADDMLLLRLERDIEH